MAKIYSDLDSKIIITGTGRAGTTFLVHVLTEMGLNTGFDKDNLDQHVDSESFGGLETTDYSAKVLKSPFFSTKIDQIVHDMNIYHVFIPMRELTKTAVSRASQGYRAGGLWGADTVEGQENYHARCIYKLIYDLNNEEIPYTVINFDKMMSSHDYLYSKLSHGMTLDKIKFINAYNKVIKKERIRF